MMEMEERVKTFDSLVRQTMQESEEKPWEPDEQDIAESLKCDIDLTKDFFNLIMQNYESLDPKENTLRKLYFDTQTFNFVMFDRLVSLAEQAGKLVDKILQNNKER